MKQWWRAMLNNGDSLFLEDLFGDLIILEWISGWVQIFVPYIKGVLYSVGIFAWGLLICPGVSSGVEETRACCKKSWHSWIRWDRWPLMGARSHIAAVARNLELLLVFLVCPWSFLSFLKYTYCAFLSFNICLPFILLYCQGRQGSICGFSSLPSFQI